MALLSSDEEGRWLTDMEDPLTPMISSRTHGRDLMAQQLTPRGDYENVSHGATSCLRGMRRACCVLAVAAISSMVAWLACNLSPEGHLTRGKHAYVVDTEDNSARVGQAAEPCGSGLTRDAGGSREDGPCTPPKELSIGNNGDAASLAGRCAESLENCASVKCCAGAGLQCFQKNETFATCREECAPGPDPVDVHPGAWSCSALGRRAAGRKPRRSAAGEDCRHNPVCADAGAQCFAKNASWAECLHRCAPGPELTGPTPSYWSCEPLGVQTPGVASWVSLRCPHRGEDCSETACCAKPGDVCYRKDPYWAECKPACDDPWDCAELGSRTPATTDQAAQVKPLSPWVRQMCSDQDQNCQSSRCCRTAGLRCYEKNTSFATCRLSCNEGPDLADQDGHPWTCRVLGPRTPMHAVPPVGEGCAAPREDCTVAGCCQEEGTQCYAKDAFWAECRSACAKGNSTWSCKEIGVRTPRGWKLPRARAPRAVIAPPAWAALQCAAPGEDCKESMCCIERGQQCFRKNTTFASCRRACDPDEELGSGGPWDCTPMGPIMPTSTTTRTTTSTTDTTTTTTTTTATTSTTTTTTATSTLTTTTSTTTSLTFFCFSVVRPDGYEPHLLRAQLAKRSGIFACQGHAVLSTAPLTLASGFQALVFQGAPVGLSSDNTAGNARLFVNAWRRIQADGQWKWHDWILKVDPDAVLLPQRLSQHLGSRKGAEVFVNNCPQGKKSALYGALEAFSNKALTTYFEDLDGKKKCVKYEANPWGEDVFIAYCLKHLGVKSADDFGIVSDERCQGVSCSDTWAAAFHPFKTVEDWTKCWQKAAKFEEERYASQEAERQAVAEAQVDRAAAQLKQGQARRQQEEEARGRKRAEQIMEQQAHDEARAEQEKAHAARRAEEARQSGAKEQALARERERAIWEETAQETMQTLRGTTVGAAAEESEALQADGEDPYQTGKLKKLKEHLQLGDVVRVRDSPNSRWRVGTVTSLQPLSVRPRGWKVGFAWAIMDVVPRDMISVGDTVRLADASVPGASDGPLRPGDVGVLLARQPAVADSSEDALLVRVPGGTSWWYRKEALEQEFATGAERASCATYGCRDFFAAAASQACDCDSGCVHRRSCCRDFVDLCLAGAPVPEFQQRFSQ